jgi:AMMECR1 domain-containing protein
MNSENISLLKLAASVVLKESMEPLDYGIWSKIQAGVFVTAYVNVANHSGLWCCYSNGEYTGKQTVVQNVEEAAIACRGDRRRRKEPPNLFEVTILAPRARWLPQTLETLETIKEQAIALIKEDGQPVIYLPSVWKENKKWDAETLERNLKAKAGVTNRRPLMSVPVYIIHTDGVGEDVGMFDEHLPGQIFYKALKFYDQSRDDRGRLAYIVEGKKLVMDNEGAWVRTFSDIRAYAILDKRGGLFPRTALSQAMEASRSITLSPAEYAALFQAIGELGKPVPAKLWDELVRPGLHDDDTSFARPQVYAALSASGLPTPSYRVDTAALHEHGAFAANWAAQALASQPMRANRSDVMLVLAVLRHFFTIHQHGSPVSIVEACCAVEGFICLVHVHLASILDDDRSYLAFWLAWVAEQQMKNGGFSYYTGMVRQRVDVTSHVVTAVMAYIQNLGN